MSNLHPSAGFDKNPQNINRNGAPKREWTWSGELERALEQIDEQSGKSFKEIISASLIREARKGNVLAIKEIMNRMDGMPKQDTNVNVEGDVTINIDELLGLSKSTTKTTESNNDTV